MTKKTPLTIYKDELLNFINTDFTIEVLDNNGSFTEGPVWSKKGYYLFSDIPENCIYKISPYAAKQVYINDSGCTSAGMEMLSQQIGSNGLAFDDQLNLLICQHGNGAIAKWNGEKLDPLIPFYQTKRLNSPNDIVVHADGTVFFSDPPYGLKNQQLNPEFCQPAAGIYCWRDGVLQLFCDKYNYPNGVCLSPDQESLYTCSNKPGEAFILEFDAVTLNLKRLVCKENGDGIKCDRYGNLYLANKEGVLILNVEGERIGLIKLDAVPANLCWGGAEGNDLLITARENIFHITNLQK
jgi:gluconolactonase